MEELKVINNEKALRFEIKLGDEFAFIDYRWYKGNIAFMHTFVPFENRGKGISSTLAKYALEYAKDRNLKIMMYCPIVAKYVKEHPEYKDLINKEYHSGN